ncbi:MAG: tetratricopeptide repeat protein [Burkholderiales bacterium]
MKARIAVSLLWAALAAPAQAAWPEAVDAYNKGDYAVAAREFRPFAENGQAVAQYILGWLYQNGEGVTRDVTESAKWYRKAAEKGHEDAQYAIGLYCLSGEGVAKDPAEAARWFRKAAERGKPGAQYLLGYLLSRGEGLDRNEAQAVDWYRKAADQGYMDAQYAYGLALSRGAGIAKDEPEANQWLRKAAEQGQIEAAYLLGWNYDKGIGVLPDYAESAKWYGVAAEGNNVEAQFHLATLVRDGRGTAKDDARALTLFKKAAAAGQADIPVAVDDYLKSSRFDAAFDLADTWLLKNPDDVQLLTVLAFAAIGEARSDPDRFAGPARAYGDKAISLIEADRKPASLSAADWAEYRSKWLPQMHMRLGSLALKTGAPDEARTRLERATAADPTDPYAWYLLGQIGYADYERISAGAKSLEGKEKDEAITQAFAKLDQVIAAYARAVGLAERQESAKELREPLMQDLIGIYEFRNGSRTGLDEVLTKYRTP